MHEFNLVSKVVEARKRKSRDDIMATDVENQIEKRVKIEEDNDDYTTLARAITVTISKTNPVVDFKALMENRSNDVVYAGEHQLLISIPPFAT